MTKSVNTQVGFIGLGNMGGPMAANLLKAGYHLTVFDLDRTKGLELEAAGAQWAENPRAVAARSEVVLTALPGPKEVEAVVLGEEGVFTGLEPDAIYVDTTTNAPDTMRKIAAIGSDRGVHVLDAPISGGVVGARDGTLTVFVGGDKETFHFCRPLLQNIGQNVVHMGPNGSGHTTKLINNAMMFINFIGACEGMAMGAKAGLDLATLRQTIASSMGQSAIFERVMDLFLSDGQMAHTTHMAIKDMHLSNELGQQLGVPLALSPLVEDLFARCRDDGHGDEDFIKVLRDGLRRAGVDVSSYL